MSRIDDARRSLAKRATDDANARCARAIRQLDRGFITFEELAAKLARVIIGATGDGMDDEGMSRCISLIPSELLPNYLTYPDQSLLPADHMPSPLPFLVVISDENIERKKIQLKPKYLRLHELVRERVAVLNRS